MLKVYYFVNIILVLILFVYFVILVNVIKLWGIVMSYDVYDDKDIVWLKDLILLKF